MSTATEALTRTTGADPGSGAVQTADRLIIFGITGDDDWTVENLRKRAHTSIEDCGETIDEDVFGRFSRSEEHTSELQSRRDLVCRLLLEKKKTTSAAIPVNMIVSGSKGA